MSKKLRMKIDIHEFYMEALEYGDDPIYINFIYESEEKYPTYRVGLVNDILFGAKVLPLAPVKLHKTGKRTHDNQENEEENREANAWFYMPAEILEKYPGCTINVYYQTGELYIQFRRFDM